MCYDHLSFLSKISLGRDQPKYNFSTGLRTVCWFAAVTNDAVPALNRSLNNSISNLNLKYMFSFQDVLALLD